MSSDGLAKRYAKALFSHAAHNQPAAQLLSDGLNLMSELYRMPDSAGVLNSPVVPKNLKKELLCYAIKDSQNKSELEAFISAVVDGKRVASIPQIAENFEKLVAEQSGWAEATITTTFQLDPQVATEICAQIEKTLKKTIRPKYVLDRSILGGMIITVGNRVLDLSLKTKLEAICQSAMQ